MHPLFDYPRSIRCPFGPGLESRSWPCIALMSLFCGAAMWLFPAHAFSESYLFSTLAGSPGLTGTNDGTGGTARFSFPTGVVPDPAGNLYVADFLNHAIRKMSLMGTNWIVTTIAGLPGVADYADGTNSDARFNRPAGIAIDTAGNLFVAERYNHVIRKITPSGTDWVVSTVAGLHGVTGGADGTNDQARFWLPSGIAVDSSNVLYVADTSNFTIRQITPVGTNWVVSTIAGSVNNFGFADGINSQALFNFPYGIAIGGEGKLYVADAGTNAIRELARAGPDWSVTTIAGQTGTAGWDDGAGGIAKFNFPSGVALDSAGNVYVADQSNYTIRKLTPQSTGWIVSTIAGSVTNAGSANGIGTNALFKKPWGVAVDKAGTVFVAEYSNSLIRSGVSLSVPAPLLQIELSNDLVTLSWPAWASNYLLETSGQLGSAGSWVAITNGITLSGQAFIFTQSSAGASAFYRLRQ